MTEVAQRGIAGVEERERREFLELERRMAALRCV
jgi:hypothetical protein